MSQQETTSDIRAKLEQYFPRCRFRLSISRHGIQNWVYCKSLLTIYVGSCPGLDWYNAAIGIGKEAVKVVEHKDLDFVLKQVVKELKTIEKAVLI